ncbi:MAG: ROK family protein [Eubacteriales bacterium]
MYSLGIDLGGTNIATAVVEEDGTILGRASISTPKELGPDLPRLVCEAMVAASKLAMEGCATWEEISSIGIGVPGTVDPTTQTIGRWSNMQFVNVPIGDIFRTALAKEVINAPPIFLENDANAAALGEFCAGAGKQASSLVAITLGTGVGGGAIFNGKLFTGFNFAGMELGHFVLHEGGRLCSCGRRGCFEAYSSATALILRTKECMEEHRESALWNLVDGDLEKVNGKVAFDGAAMGDETAKFIVDEYVRFLASGMVSLINILQPEVLCIGGGVAGQKEVLLTPLQAIVDHEDYARENPNRSRLSLAQLGNDAGIIGAAFLEKFR